MKTILRYPNIPAQLLSQLGAEPSCKTLKIRELILVSFPSYRYSDHRRDFPG